MRHATFSQKFFAVLVSLFGLVITAHGQRAHYTAQELDDVCQQKQVAVDDMSKSAQSLKIQKKDVPKAAYLMNEMTCLTYIQSWADASDMSIYVAQDDKLRRFILKDDWREVDLADALHNHLRAEPLDKGKHADVVLMVLALDKGIATSEPVISPSGAR